MTTSDIRKQGLPPALVYFLSIIAVVAIGGLIGTTTGPDAWFAGLVKPSFNPPAWLFAPVWTTLYVMIGIAFARTYLRDPKGPAMKAWIVQMLLNWSWTPLWFGLHLMWAALAVIVVLWCTIITFIVISRRTDPVSAYLFIPYLAWVSFATVLNASLAILNS
jgi:translocator protein